MEKERAIEIIKDILNNAIQAEMFRGYFRCDDYTYYTQNISDDELTELGLPIPDREEL